MLLATTALEETWGKNEDILFLGEWCKLYDRKHVWSKREFETVPYHWDDRQKLKNDYVYLQKLNDDLLKELTSALNELHGVDHSVLYWRIVLGYWLNLFTGVLFDRWEMIKFAVDFSTGLKSFVFEIPDNQIVANDSSDFNKFITSDFWNQAIYERILSYYPKMNIHRLDFIPQIRTIENFSKVQSVSRIKKSIKSGMNWFFKVTSREKDPFIKNSYLPFQKETLLYLSTGALPKYWSSPEIETYQYNESFRCWNLTSDVAPFYFGGFVRAMIPKLLPKIFLEGYKDIVALSKKLSWPKRPRFILTANSHYSDDGFKVWAAYKKESGTPFITADHGGFGINSFNGGIKYQLDISDLSLSWGWEDKKYPHVKPIGIVKTIGKKAKWDPKGFGLMVELAMPRYSFDLRSMVISGQMLGYFEDQFCFYDSLPDHIQNKILVRLYHQDYGWQQKKRWQDRFANVHIDEAEKSIYSQLQKTRIYISTYNATSYLESLSLNIPTIIFWNPDHWEIRDDAVPYFDLLKKAGIYHNTPQSAAAKLMEIWDHVPDWWHSREIQQVRQTFCHRYARKEDNPVKVIKKILDTAIS